MANGGNYALKLIRSIWKYNIEGGSFDRVLEKVKIVSAGGGNCVAEMCVEREHENRGSTLHGGFSATLVDVVSTMALMTTEKQAPGVSVDLSVTFLKAARPGDEIVIDARTLKAGNRLAFLSVDIKNKETGELIVQGKHTKFIG